MMKKLNDKEHEIILNILLNGVRSFASGINNNGVVIGLSGGIDSALVASLAVSALGNNSVTGVLMPSEFSSKHSIDDALLLAKNLSIKTITIPIKNIYNTFKNTLTESILNSDLDNSIKTKAEIFDVSYENMQARIRGSILMTLSNKYNFILLNTGNRSESAMGYCTMHGDMCGALAVIGELYKTEVFSLSRYINKKNGSEIIPKSSIEKPPSAELRAEQKDSDSLPDYEILDSILELYLDKKLTLDVIDVISSEYNRETIEWIIKQYNSMTYKREYAPKPIKVRNIISSFDKL